MSKTTGPSTEDLAKSLFIVDASSYIFRAYYAIRSGLSAPDGTPTHATFGFVQMLKALVNSYPNSSIVFVWDRPDKGFRHEIFPAYKSNRSEPPEDLGVQIENVRRIIDALGFPQIDRSGFEADDIIATLTRGYPDRPLVVVTSDKDLLQLVGPMVWCLDTMKNKWANTEEAIEKFGVTPEKIKFVQALSGDAVDHIPGAPGIGPKTATELIQYYGSLDRVIEEALLRHKDPSFKPKDKSDPLKGKRIESIASNVDQIRISLELVSLHPVSDIRASEETFARRSINQEELGQISKALGFSKVLGEYLDHKTISDVKDQKSNTQFLAKMIADDASWLDLINEASNASLLTLDTETKSLDSLKARNIVGLSLHLAGDEAFYVPLQHVDGPNLMREAWAQDLNVLLGERAKAKRPVLFHNAKFDLHVLQSNGVVIPEDLIIEDSMVLSYVFDPGDRHGMDALAQKYLDYSPQPFSEVLADRGNFSEVPVADATHYSAEDAWVTRRLFDTLKEKVVNEFKLWRVYETLDRPLVPILAAMEAKGMLLERTFLEQFSRDLHAELTTLETAAKASLEASGVPGLNDFNLGSPKQVGVILYEHLKLPILKRNKTGPSTDVSVLEELAHQHDFPRLLLEIRELSKLLSTYVDSFPSLIREETGRLHTDFSQTITGTGRLSSSNPNLQNIPIRTDRGRKLRQAFVAAPGMKLIALDYSQVELRILAHITQDAALLQAFGDGADIHKRTAALILGKSEADVDDDDRRLAKTINFGIIYGQTAFGLAKQLKISQPDAQRFIDAYHKCYPGIEVYSTRAIEEARKTGFVYTLCGRRRRLTDIHSKNYPLRQFAERMAINSPIQGTASDLIKKAMIDTTAALQQEKIRGSLILQVHDELLLEVSENDATRAFEITKSVMENRKILESFGIVWAIPIAVDGAIGDHWGAL